ncbi:uncharacterized protein Z518_02503 [Rhinocladiella mackenziei CBS 650.93]|uniref:Potassium channel tetramerisation-type BTB domain-containing protein n=1 Tax=Rhinocladiella mackenziei CBS 650.93 TaxID=1442369 RepID=A0A0D2IPM6_9EURO|nr:uncharacterized protein Z518_02503 [Rhinocladiella mackenziei CBS 650.93]KIX07849.1 hypothetical protein Z518_02503 [Rhinocladiella mackenziei CBS 650.93]
MSPIRTRLNTHQTSPAISISPMPDGRRTGAGATAGGAVSAAGGPGPVQVSGQAPGPEATNHPSATASVGAYTTISERDAEPADAANPSPDTRPVFPRRDLEYPTVAVHDTDSQHLLVASSTDAAATSYALGPPSFGSQPWVAPSGPFLDFAPQPIYEPTGELRREDIHTFDEFDAPSISRFTTALSASPPNNPPPPPTNAVEVATAPNGAGSVTAFVQPSLPRSALKRKASSVATTPTDSSTDKKIRAPTGTGAGSGPGLGPGIRLDSSIANSRSVTFERMSGIGPTSPDEGSTSSDAPAGSRAIPSAVLTGNRRTRQSSGSTPRPSLNPQSSSQSSNRGRGTRPPSGHPPSILPPEKVFPIQIGSDLFRLSGASISSDAPSYFTQFFEEQIRQNEESGGVRTLYIDRDPATFRDVARHLQGYYVKPVDGSHFVKLFADAQFYSLPRLIDQLFESEIFIQIGERHFQIPKDIFSEPGNSPNFFSLGFAVFFSTPGEVFPGLDRRGLLRPPSITPPYVPGRSAEIFAELLHLLRGYPLHIRNEAHRAELLRDCRYFHLRGLEQKIIAHEISYNLERQKHEICLRLEDVKPSGVSYTSDDSLGDKSTVGGWVYYARPFVDDTSYEMVVEIGGESTVLDLADMRADFHGLAKARVSSLFQVVANKMNLPTNAPLGLMMLSGGRSSQSASPGHTPLSEDRVKVRFETATDIVLDGESFEIDGESSMGQIMLHGPSTAPSESESESDVMGEGTSSKPLPPTGSGQQRRPQTRQAQTSSLSQTAGSRGSLPVPPIQTSRLYAPSTKKRKRHSSPGEFGEWTIRTGQWRLRVQPNIQDTIRGGFEIVFIGVKIDAYSSERARNARRAFLN